MIKIKLDIDNFKCFSGLIHAKSILPDYSIELVSDVIYSTCLFCKKKFKRMSESNMMGHLSNK